MRPLMLFILLSMIVPVLLIGADGFAYKTTGGAGGATVTVTNAADFSTYSTSPSPYTIIVSGTITFAGDAMIGSNKTIQGADSNATIKGDIFIGVSSSNVIIQYLHITNPDTVGDGDGITVVQSKNVFINHCTFTDCRDGSCDIVQASDSVTLAWCRFRYPTNPWHRYVNLIGNNDSYTADMGKLHVTIHHCWYDQNCVERLPSVRYGTVHCYNNYYSAAGNNYCIRTRLYAQCLVENNYFENVKNPWELLRNTGVTDGKLWASNNNAAYLDTSFGIRWLDGWYTATNQISVLIPGTDAVFTPPYTYSLDNAADAKNKVIAKAGNKGSVTDGVHDDPPTIDRLTLDQNYPNPFNPSTTIVFHLSKRSTVVLTVFNLLGKAVAVLDNETLPAGDYTRQWNAAGIPSGVYFSRLQTGSFSETKKLVLLK